ncbi:MAG: 4-hydroxy-tetrahydrodipicolinate synthase [Candidatus Obscuribacterales bacterium]|nr:4-hydroxy-tetrahydrodipicolinate synthase [Candidatus Obscuribacterales bacterium]
MIGTDGGLFGRMVTAMVTPFDDNLKIDYAATERIVEHLLNTGTTGIVVSGTTGESPVLEDDEKRELLKFVVSKVKGRASIVMGTGSNDTAKSVKASREAESLGADGLLVVAPYYNKPSQDGLKAHFSAVASAAALPVMLYNIPGRTGINITSETTLSLAEEFPNIRALKDSTGSVEQAQETARLGKDCFRIYSGDDYLTLPFLSVGGCGVVSVASHLIGVDIRKMIDSFFDGKIEDARLTHYKCLPVFKGLFTAPNPTCVKYALSKMGLCKPNLRLPLVPLSEPQRKAIDELLKEVKPHGEAKLAS